MPEMKNICGKIPVDLHERVRQEIEEKESSTQIFIQQVIEEHFMRKGESSMAARTIAVQVNEDLFGRLKEVLLRKGCKQKDFLLEIIEQAIAAEEAKWKGEGEQADSEEPEESDAKESDEEEPEAAQESKRDEGEEPSEPSAEDEPKEEQESTAEAKDDQPEESIEAEEEE